MLARFGSFDFQILTSNCVHKRPYATDPLLSGSGEQLVIERTVNPADQCLAAPSNSGSPRLKMEPGHSQLRLLYHRRVRNEYFEHRLSVYLTFE